MRKIALWVLAAATTPVAAATFEVSNLADSGLGSLRQAVLDANALAGADEVTFQSGLTGTIELSSGEIDVTDDLTISDPEHDIAVSGGDKSPIFHIENPAALIDVTISGLQLGYGRSDSLGGVIQVAGESLTIRDSTIVNGSSIPNSLGRGGCISAIDSTLRIERSTISGGTSLSGKPGDLGVGGNLFVSGGSFTMEQSTVNGGSANLGGGLLLSHVPALIRDSRIIGNHATGVAGGIWMDVSSVTLERTTIANNSSQSGGGGLFLIYGSKVLAVNSTISSNRAEASEGGGAYVTIGGELVLRLSTLSDNTAASGGGSIHVAGSGSSLDLDHAIVANGTPQDLSGGTINAVYSLVEAPGTAIDGTSVNNLFGVDPKLGPLADNGGPTETHALLLGSPAINAGDPLIPDPPPTDQRGAGFFRIFNNRVDLGSFELQQDVGVVGVPALSPVALAMLMALLAGVGLWMLRR